MLNRRDLDTMTFFVHLRWPSFSVMPRSIGQLRVILISADRTTAVISWHNRDVITYARQKLLPRIAISLPETAATYRNGTGIRGGDGTAPGTRNTGRDPEIPGSRQTTNFYTVSVRT